MSGNAGAVQRVLVVWYSQSGQTRGILERMLAPLAADPGVELTWDRITPVEDFPFPWTAYAFFDAFPESARLVPRPLRPPGFDPGASWDLVVLGWQPWFLSLSVPVTSFLRSAAGREALRGRPVVTVCGCRNMWIAGMEKLRGLLAEAGARLAGHVVLRDRAPNLASAAGILRWMLTGRRDRFLGVFPPAGVSPADIEESARFGEIILRRLRSGRWDGMQDELRGAGAVEVFPNLAAIERRGSRIFDLWAGFILKKGGPGAPARRFRVRLFMVYLPAALALASPLVSLLAGLAARLFPRRAKALADRHAGIEFRPPPR